MGCHSPAAELLVVSRPLWLHVSWLRVCVGASSGDGEPGKWAISGLSPPHACSRGSPDGAVPLVTCPPVSCSPTWQWFRDGSPLPDSHSTYSVSNKERTLTLQSASPNDNGLYYCCARSAIGFVCSHNNFTLNVIDESFPQAVIVPQDLIVTKNEEAMFDCQFAAVPPPTQEWLFEDNPVTNRSK
ncbi:hypothetical protein DV515_00004135 [Chloebia gouldiae]|uniref:Ig-like domain-containing protein n=1 Tax=Chloebia gouldiae TaxID=44316 RepID=A0A3L8SR40_CHLGU|nr:hypothetical protein DV515_00004135 [Chloebia gouldiae]